MTKTEVTNDRPANKRFVKAFLKRHQGDAHAALREARELGEMSDYGRAWWAYIGSQLAFCMMFQAKP